MKLSSILYVLLILFVPFYSFSQLSGRVVNDQNEGVPFASISIKGTSKGTQTDSSGRFSFTVSERYPFTLVISSVGFSPAELVIRNNTTNNVLVPLQALYKSDTIITV